jgi:hypothetical protein
MEQSKSFVVRVCYCEKSISDLLFYSIHNPSMYEIHNIMKPDCVTYYTINDEINFEDFQNDIISLIMSHVKHDKLENNDDVRIGFCEVSENLFNFIQLNSQREYDAWKRIAVATNNEVKTRITKYVMTYLNLFVIAIVDSNSSESSSDDWNLNK